MVVLEVAIVSNYQWTEKQIQAAIKKGRKRSQEDWLGVAVFKVGDTRDVNKKKAIAPDYRQLMKILVGLKHAFDNELSADSPEYKICFNWEEREQYLAKLKRPSNYFPLDLLAHPAMLDLPPKEKLNGKETAHYLDRPLTTADKAMFGLMIIRWGAIRNTLLDFSSTGKLRLEKHLEDHPDNQLKKAFIGTVAELVCRWEAISIGWPEIKDYCPKDWTPEALFIELIRMQSYADFIDACTFPEKGYKPSTLLKKLQSVSKIIQPVNCFLEGSPKIPLEDPSKTIGEDYNAGIDEVADALKAAISVLHRFPMRKYWVDRITTLRHCLIQSSDPEIKKAAVAWEKAAQVCFSGGMGIVRKEKDRRTDNNIKAE